MIPAMAWGDGKSLCAHTPVQPTARLHGPAEREVSCCPESLKVFAASIGTGAGLVA